MEHSFITHYMHIMRLGYKFRKCPVPGVSPHCSNDSPIHVYLVILYLSIFEIWDLRSLPDAGAKQS